MIIKPCVLYGAADVLSSQNKNGPLAPCSSYEVIDPRVDSILSHFLVRRGLKVIFAIAPTSSRYANAINIVAPHTGLFCASSRKVRAVGFYIGPLHVENCAASNGTPYFRAVSGGKLQWSSVIRVHLPVNPKTVPIRAGFSILSSVYYQYLVRFLDFLLDYMTKSSTAITWHDLMEQEAIQKAYETYITNIDGTP